jgi:hypothetical protein
MPTDNYDASELTRRTRAAYLNAYYTNMQTAKALNPYVNLQEQGSAQILDDVTQRQNGNCTCATNYIRRNIPGVTGAVNK